MVPLRAMAILGFFSATLAACGSNPPYNLGPVGGPGGTSFDEYSDGSVPANSQLIGAAAPTQTSVCGFPDLTLVHYIQGKYGPPPGFDGPMHGNGPVCPTRGHEFRPPGLLLPLPQGEFLTGIFGRAAANIDRLEFITNKSGFTSFDQIEQKANQISSGGHPFFLLAPPGYKITRWFGRSAAVLDAIGIRTEEEPTLSKTGFASYKLGAVGGWGGTAFEDPPVSASARVTTVTVTYGCYVSGVKLDYSDGSNREHGRPDIGIIGGCVTTTQSSNLDPDEFIVGVNGRSGKYVDQLAFVTNKSRTIGPFGGNGGEPFNLIGPRDYRVKRLFGRSGALIDALGIIVEK